jgi:hypothetical protein
VEADLCCAFSVVNCFDKIMVFAAFELYIINSLTDVNFAHKTTEANSVVIRLSRYQFVSSYCKTNYYGNGLNDINVS